MSTENKFEIAVRESGMALDSPKAKELLESFQDYFKIAADWEKKAATLVVTDASQTAVMKMAREGRLFLKGKRVAIEKMRKKLKEQSVREGRAIDGMANILKALIVPLEEHLDKQERFVEIRAAEEAEKLRLEAEEEAEGKRIAKEKADAVEKARLRLENMRLQQEAKKERESAEQELEAEKDKTDRIEAEREAERKTAAAEKQKAEKLRADLEAKLKTQITCPHCGKKLYPDGSC